MAQKVNKGRNKGWDNLKPCKPGETHNPNGRPKGQRNYSTIYREALEELAKQKNVTADQLENIILKVGIAKAIAGDPRFYADLLDRLYGKAAQPLTGANGKDLIPSADAKADADAAIEAYLADGAAKR